MNHKALPFIRAMLLFIVSKLLACLKISFVIGSVWTLFSLRNIIAPLAGAFGGIAGAIFFFTSNICSALLFKKVVLLSFLAYSGIPTFCAGLYWASTLRIIRVGIPALCIVLFVLHSEGMAAWPYALFWLIPIIITCINSASIFMTALASTFTAHAVGSVLWLYTTSMAASGWYALLPIVPLERLLFASGMTIMHVLFSWIFAKNVHIYSRRFHRASE